MVFFVNFGSEIEIGNNTKLGQKFGFKSISVMNLAKAKKKNLNFKFTVWWIDKGIKSCQPHQAFAFPVVLELVWSSPFLYTIPITGKPWNLFSSISLVNSLFISFSLVSYHFICNIKYVEGQNRQGTYTASLVDYHVYTITKGQFISKCPLGVIVSTKKPTKFF